MKGIIFDGENVKKLAGKKTQTRRIVKPQPLEAGFGRKAIVRPYCTGTDWPLAYYEMRGACWANSQPLKPRYQVGETVYVKEAFGECEGIDGDADAIIYRCGYWVRYYRDNKFIETDEKYFDKHLADRWKSPRYMPEWASRLKLKITGVRVERIQDISDADIQAEGFSESHYYCDERVGHVCTSPKDLFINRWDWTNKTNKWDSNPFVWVYEFEKAEVA